MVNMPSFVLVLVLVLVGLFGRKRPPEARSPGHLHPEPPRGEVRGEGNVYRSANTQPTDPATTKPNKPHSTPHIDRSCCREAFSGASPDPTRLSVYTLYIASPR